ncbi:MAG: carbon-nitrogen hydrolase family protein, partial [Planctomycetes bacterium]|nr:carbon-nitrogen hydrolase family protein [Planctomycetota bacterium]
ILLDGGEEEALLSVNVDWNEVAKVRKMMPVLQHRKAMEGLS